ncbi:hypothetical protein EKD04_009645 [Chloroflexales bacterium ZM16-3]|nr:hypothetical protein [Chloroflexales bacterium ZM16-3]
MSLSLGDILLHFRAKSTEVDSAFTRIDRQALDFARRNQDRLMSRFTGDTSGIDQAASRSEGMLQSWSGRVKGYIAQSLTMPVGNLIAGAASNVLGAIKGSVIGMNAQLEDSTLQFTTLMGDADLAREHVLSLFKFAKDTPFETGPILQASRLLQTFGGNALNSNAELLRLGDAAAVAGKDISQVGFWYGRLYSSIKNKQPFGEAAMAMQEMGVMSGETRIRLEAMQKSGVDGATVWAAFGAEMDKNAGAMLRMATTWTGLTSTLADTINIGGAKVFAPFFQMAKEAVMLVVNILSTPRFDSFLNKGAEVMQGVANAIRGAAESVLPIVGIVWGVIEPLLAVAVDWGAGFVKAFADGITLATGLAGDALGGMADLITGLLEPHSPPKILPNLDKWGTKAAQVWMNAWGQADYSVFSQIGAAVKSALDLAVGKGALSEAQLIPTLSATKAALAELITGYEQTGEVSEASLAKMTKAAGPAGQAVAEIAVAYLQVEAANRAVERSQLDLNEATKRYDAVLAPLNAQMAALDRQASAINDTKKLAQLQADMRNATGSDRELLIIEMKQISLRKQIATQTQARDTAVKAAQSKIDAAQQEAAAAKTSLAVMQAKQKVEEEGLAMAKQQVTLLTSLAKGAAAQAKSTDAVKKSIDDANSSAAKMTERVNGLIGTMGKMREKGSAAVKPLTDALTVMRKTWDNTVSAFKSNGVTGALVSLVSAAGGVKLLLTPMGKQVIGVTNTLNRFGEGLVALPKILRNAFSGFQSNGITGAVASLAGATGNIKFLFTPLGKEILAFTTALPGRIAAISTTLGGMAQRLAALAATKIGTNIQNGMAVAATAVERLSRAAGMLGVAWAAAKQRFAEGGNVFSAGNVLAAIQAFFGELAGTLLASGKGMARNWVTGLTAALPEGLRAKLPLIAGMIASVLGALTLGPGIASMFAALAPVGALLAPLGLALGPVLGLFGKLGPLLRSFLPVLGRLGPTFMTLLNPLNLLKGGLGSIFTTLGVTGLKMIAIVKNPIASLSGLFRGIGPALLGLKNPIGMLLNVGKLVMGLFSPLGIVIGLVALFAGAFATNFGGIQGIVAETLAPLMPVLGELGRILKDVVLAALQGDWSGALIILTGGFALLGPMLGQVAASFQTGIPAIFGVLMQFLGQIGTTVIGAIGAYLPGILTALAGMAAAFLGWVAPMIPPMLIAIGGMLGQLLDAIGAALPGIIETLATIAAQFLAWIGPMVPPMLLGLMLLFTSLIGWIAERAPGVLAKLGEWGLNLVAWIAPMIAPMLVAAGGILAAILGWIIEKAPDILAKLGEWGTQFATWARDVAGPALKTALGTMFSGLWTELQKLWGAAFADGSLGASLLAGMKQGIIDGWGAFSGWFVAKLKTMIPDWAKGPLGMNAPTAPPPPGLATGGDVTKGQRYIVGEQGPEFFVAPADGIIEPHSVYQAVTDPLASVSSAISAGKRPAPRAPWAAAALAAAGGGGGAAPSGSASLGPLTVGITINNPVVDSDARLEQFKREVLAEATAQFTAAVNRLTLSGV